MIDNNDGTGQNAVQQWWSENAPASAASPASASPPVLSPEYGLTEPPEAPEVPARSSKLPWIAALVGTLILLGGGSLLAVSAFAATGGADTPEAAVDALLAAADAEDFITIGELLEPSERRTIVEPTITELLPELVRLGVFEERLDPGDVEGIDFEFIDVTYRVDSLANASDMVHVYFTGGEVASEFDAALFPVTDAFRREVGDELQSEERTVETIEETENPMVLVERNGRWFVSGMFTIAENARLAADQPLPSAAEAPRTRGSDSPEAAVENMFADIVDMNLASLIGRMDPDEMAVLYRYSPLFLDEGQAELDNLASEMSEEGVTWNISEWDLESSTDGDDGVVEIRGFTLDVNAPDFDLTFTYSRDLVTGSLNVGDAGSGTLSATTTQWDIEGTVDGETIDIEIRIDPDNYSISGSGSVAGESGTAEIVFDPDGGCSRYSVSASDGTDESGCLEEQIGSGSLGLVEQYVAFFDEWENEFPGISMTVRRTDGEWYISPIGTMFDAYLGIIGRLEENDFDALGNSTGVVGPFGAAGALAELGDEIDRSIVNNDSFTIAEPDELMEDEGTFEESDIPSVGFEVEIDDKLALDLGVGATLTVVDDLRSNAYDIGTLPLDAGDSLRVTMQAGVDSSIDSLVIVRGPDGNVIAENDDADPTVELDNVFDSQLEIVAEASGMYTVEMHSFGDFGEGTYELSLERS